MDIESIGSFLENREDGKNLVVEFREKFPGISLTRCDSQDMSGETPYRSVPGFDLYLVDRRDHCWKITGNPEEATGVVLAERKI